MQTNIKTKSKTKKSNTIAAGHPRTHILVVDDDPLFRAMIAKLGEKRNLRVTTCASVQDIDAIKNPEPFDVVVVDYFLDGLKEHMKGTDVAFFLESTPVVLVSNSDECVHSFESWPDSVRKFLNKKDGINAILDSAVQLGSPVAVAEGRIA